MMSTVTIAMIASVESAMGKRARLGNGEKRCELCLRQICLGLWHWFRPWWMYRRAAVEIGSWWVVVWRLIREVRQHTLPLGELWVGPLLELSECSEGQLNSCCITFARWSGWIGQREEVNMIGFPNAF